MPDDNKPKSTPNDNSTNSSSTDSVAPTQPTPIVTTPAQQQAKADDKQTESDKESDKSKDVDAVVTSAHVPKKYGGKKIIATMFGVALLLGAVAAGVYLVQRQQQIAERAASGSACQQDPDCILLEDPGNNGSFTAPRNVTKLYITARYYHEFAVGQSDDGCYKVNVSGSFITWERYGSGPDCKDISNIQIWLEVGGPSPTPLPTETPMPSPTTPPGTTPTNTPTVPTNTPTPTLPPDIVAECSTVTAYDTNWNSLSKAELADLNPGDTVYFTVYGTANNGSFDKARFYVNGSPIGESTNKKPGSEEFYIEYTIPDGVTSFSVKGEVHHTDLGWI